MFREKTDRADHGGERARGSSIKRVLPKPPFGLRKEFLIILKFA